MTAINPFIYLWWAAVGAMLVMKITAYGGAWLPVMIVVHWLCDLAWLTLVSVLIYRTKGLWGLNCRNGFLPFAVSCWSVRRVVFDFRHSEILVRRFAVFNFAQITNRDFAVGAVHFHYKARHES